MALRVIRFYILLSAAWIILSDGLVYLHGEGSAAGTLVGMAKGLLYVAVTATLLYLFMTRWVRASEALGERLRQLSRYANDIVLLSDQDGRLIDANDRAAEAYGYSLASLLTMDIGRLRAGDGPPPDHADLWQGRDHVLFETTHRRSDGAVFPVEVSARRVEMNGRRLVQSIIRDISERKAAEQQIVRLKDIYAALSQTNQCIVRVADRVELFRTICEVAIRFGHFRMAWVGLIDEAGKRVLPVERAGQGTAFLDRLEISTRPSSPYSAGVTGQASITGRHCIQNDLDLVIDTTGRQRDLAAAGVASAGAFPLFTAGRVIGTLTLYSGEPGFFTPELIELLGEMATDISYALDRMAAEADRRRLEQDLAASNARVVGIIEGSQDVIATIDCQMCFTGFNRAYQAASRKLFGTEARLGSQVEELLLHRADRAEAARRWQRALSGEHFAVEWVCGHPDGPVYYDSHFGPLYDPDGRLLGAFHVGRDTTKRREAEENAAFLTYHDALTRLPNRILGKDRMERAMLNADRAGRKAALLVVNVDHFKRINDSLGMAVADSLLQALTGRIFRCIRETDTLCRQGSDEFLVALAGITDPEAINRVAVQILEHTIAPFTIGAAELSITVSIGIALYPDDGGDFDTLLRRANTAMRHAKDAGRNTYRFFADRMNVDAGEYLMLLNGLRRATARDEFVLHYQPQLSVATGQVVGAEALIRWNHPELGLVAPGRFIAIAEDSGVIVEMGEWVLREACRQGVRWQQDGLGRLVVAVNLSAVQFKRGGLLESVQRALDQSGLDPELLELELTESILIKDTANVLATVRQLRAQGVRLSIDDFGTGYSSLAYLRQLDLDKLKIDQSFIRDLASNRSDETIVKAIVQLAQGLGLKTIAEGVEDAETFEMIRAHGCDEVQGYYLARPMPPPGFAAYLESVAASRPD